MPTETKSHKNVDGTNGSSAYILFYSPTICKYNGAQYQYQIAWLQ